jgi:hypothetical protein
MQDDIEKNAAMAFLTQEKKLEQQLSDPQARIAKLELALPRGRHEGVEGCLQGGAPAEPCAGRQRQAIQGP